MTSEKISKLIQYINEHRDISKANLFLRTIRKINIWLLGHECRKKNAYIPTSAHIGKNICFPHGISGIFISQGAHIGDNAVIFHQVTIGSNTLKDSKGFGAPTIGNNVYIGAGAKIIGNIVVGDSCRIGANVAVTKNIPENATVVLAEPKIILRSGKRDNSFKSFRNNS